MKAFYYQYYYRDDLHVGETTQQTRLWKLTSQQEMENIVKLLSTGDRALKPGFRSVVVQVAYMAVRDEKEWETVREVSSCAPLLTDKQSKVLTLLAMLQNTESPAKDVVRAFAEFVRHSLFSKNRLATYKISQLANLSRMYMAAVRLLGKDS